MHDNRLDEDDDRFTHVDTILNKLVECTSVGKGKSTHPIVPTTIAATTDDFDAHAWTFQEDLAHFKVDTDTSEPITLGFHLRSFFDHFFQDKYSELLRTTATNFQNKDWHQKIDQYMRGDNACNDFFLRNAQLLHILRGDVPRPQYTSFKDKIQDTLTGALILLGTQLHFACITVLADIFKKKRSMNETRHQNNRLPDVNAMLARPSQDSRGWKVKGRDGDLSAATLASSVPVLGRISTAIIIQLSRERWRPQHAFHASDSIDFAALSKDKPDAQQRMLDRLCPIYTCHLLSCCVWPVSLFDFDSDYSLYGADHFYVSACLGEARSDHFHYPPTKFMEIIQIFEACFAEQWHARSAESDLQRLGKYGKRDEGKDLYNTVLDGFVSKCEHKWNRYIRGLLSAFNTMRDATIGQTYKRKYNIASTPAHPKKQSVYDASDVQHLHDFLRHFELAHTACSRLFDTVAEFSLRLFLRRYLRCRLDEALRIGVRRDALSHAEINNGNPGKLLDRSHFATIPENSTTASKGKRPRQDVDEYADDYEALLISELEMGVIDDDIDSFEDRFVAGRAQQGIAPSSAGTDNAGDEDDG